MKDQGLEDIFITGYRGIDGEHHLQMELLDAFVRAVADGRDRGTIDEILDRLIDYTKMHFSSEQLLMRLYQYPRFQDHLEDHDQTIERLQALREAHAAGDRTLALETADVLSEALRAHIHSSDRALGHFLVRLGVGPG